MKKIYAIMIFLGAWAALAGCHKDKEMDAKDPVVTNEEMTISETQACFSWCVDFAGEFKTGVELSQNETMTDIRRVEATKEGDRYVAVVDGLTKGTKYYYRIVVWNTFKEYDQPVGEFTTSQTYTVTLSCLPEEGGTTTGGGIYHEGDTCMITAAANANYEFVNWTKEDGTQVSTEASYTFTVTESVSCVAHFQLQSYTVVVSANPPEGGQATGGAVFSYGGSCTVTATCNPGFAFTNWTEEGNEVSTAANYSFTVTGDRALEANFTLLPPNEYAVSVSASPSEGGTVTGGGIYEEGQQCIVTATANAGYAFVNWTKADGTVVSTEASYAFTVTESVAYVAHFQLLSYTISVCANPTNGGTVTGGGSYNYGESCTVTASSSMGYAFINWTENDTEVSATSSYTFVVTGDRVLVAQFYFNATAPTVTTNNVTNINQTTATSGGNVTNSGGVTVTERGICWSMSHDPTISDSHAQATQAGTGSFTVNMTGLTGGTTYYVRAYAMNSVGISYGEEKSFTTLNTPTVTTNEVTNISSTSARGSGKVTDSGGVTVTQRGVCWSTNHNPTTSGSHATSGTGLGDFNVNMTGLTPGTTYYVRAYAKNSVGTAYGEELSFTTTIAAPTVTTSPVTDINPTYATGGGNVTSSGGATVTQRGVCWSTNHDPTTSDSHASTSGGVGTFTVSMTGLTENTVYYARAYATNSAGTSYGSEVTFNTYETYTYTYNFDNSSLSGWTTIDADGDGNVWRLASVAFGSTGQGHNSSTDCVVSHSYENNYGPLYPNNYLVSPQVPLGGVITFYACAQDASYPSEHFGVAVSITNNTSPSAFTMLQEWTMTAKKVDFADGEEHSRGGRTQGNWYQYTVDLSAYLGQIGYIAIRHFNCSDWFAICVDDIVITNESK